MLRVAVLLLLLCVCVCLCVCYTGGVDFPFRPSSSFYPSTLAPQKNLVRRGLGRDAKFGTALDAVRHGSILVAEGL